MGKRAPFCNVESLTNLTEYPQVAQFDVHLKLGEDIHFEIPKSDLL